MNTSNTDKYTNDFISTYQVWELLEEDYALVDVRSPQEYANGHIPQAISLPLFNDEERSKIGLLYKEEGKESAILEGLQIVGPKLKNLVEKAKEISPAKKIILHCWRGGMRSKSLAWLYKTSGFEIFILQGGYKSYREYCRNYIADKNVQLIVIGGKTGSGKTQVLKELAAKGEQILDLEAMAHHKGSAFGWIGESAQLQNEQFENDVFEKLRRLDTEKVIWIENESRKIGKNYLPEWLWAEMKVARLIQINIDLSNRIIHLINTYKSVDKNNLKLSFTKIRKKIGFLQEQTALDFIDQDNLKEAALIALKYYDSCYSFGYEKSNSQEIKEFTFENVNFEEIGNELINYKNTLSWKKKIKSG